MNLLVQLQTSCACNVKLCALTPVHVYTPNLVADQTFAARASPGDYLSSATSTAACNTFIESDCFDLHLYLCVLFQIKFQSSRQQVTSTYTVYSTHSA